METKVIRVLLIEDDPEDVDYLREILSGEQNPSIELISAENLEKGILAVTAQKIDVILLDLSLPGTVRLETFRKLYNEVREIPIVILTGTRDEQLAMEAVSEGAQDYLVKGDADAKMLVRVMRYAIGRKQVELSLNRTQEFLGTVVTGAPIILFAINREGIFTLAEGKGLQALGIHSGELVGKSVYEYYKDNPPFLEQVRRALSGEIFTTQLEFSGISFEAWCSPIYNGGGKVGGMMGVATDITGRKKAEAALGISERRFSLFMQNLSGCAWIKNWDGTYVFVNPTYETHFHLSPSQMIGKTDYDHFPAETADQFRKNDLWVIEHKKALETVEVIPQEDGLHYWLVNKFPIHAENGAGIMVGGMAVDITDRVHSKEELIKLSIAVEQSPASIMITDTEGRIEYVNVKFTEVTGYTLDEVKGKKPSFLKTGETPLETYKQLWDTILDGREWRGEFRNRKKSGEHYWEQALIAPIRNTEGKVTHFLAIKEDITKRKWSEEALVHMAYYDSLTDLPNRFLIYDRLNQALSHARRKKKMAGVLSLGLDRFKNINDAFGHTVGDGLLQAVAKRLSDICGKNNFVARVGGDEFMIILPELKNVEEALQMAQQIQDAIRPVFSLEGHEIHVTVSIGISVYPSDGDDVETLLKDANTAMDRAKQRGRNNYQLYTPTMHVETFGRMVLENNMRKALGREEFRLHYQPFVELKTRRITGMEALLRWEHPDIGLVSPVEFIPIAEESGLIVPIGEWVLRTACKKVREWADAGLPQLSVAVNLSARQFQQANLLEMIESVLKDTGLNPESLELEITESIAMENVAFTLSTLRQLRDRGVRISIDDFGTGYSSLNYLKEFPISALKIDRSFIRDLVADPADAAIVSAMIVLAHSLSLQVVAEGVETQEQLDFLKKNKCDIVQGFLFSKPVPADQFQALVSNKKKI
ncbi:MAG: EAL domain-containing protein [Candidatus Omnitrophica bacterium]|nr:EAL domain-containing protein [Candidatus Omnitrophota bacterium]